MARGRGKLPPRFTKSNLPEKICAACGRPFAWRKAWAKVWHEVRYCSDRCRKAPTVRPLERPSDPG